MKHGKNYRAKEEILKAKKVYTVEEAMAKLKEFPAVKFDETIEVSINLGIDPKKGEQQVRGSVSMPAGIGKSVKVAVITGGDNLKIAEKAGADIVGAEDLIERINGGFTDFDVLLATPEVMPKVGKLGKVLGRKGLMPSPKAGTVVTDVARGVAEQKKGKVEYKSDKTGVIHTIIGKKSFTADQLRDNYVTLFDAVQKAKPSTVKGVYIKSVYLSPTMGPSVSVIVNN